MRWPLLSLTLLTVACSTTPSAPSPATTAVVATPSAPTPTTPAITLAGTVTATNGGQPLPGVTLNLDSFPTPTSTTTSSSGAYTFTIPPTMITVSLTAQGAGLLPHRLVVSLLASRTLNVDAIAAAGFDLAFYRRLARNGFDAPDHLEALRHLTHAPSVYLRTTDDVGAPIDARTLDATEATIRDAVRSWTAGRWSVAVVDRGRTPPAGWLTINWHAGPAIEACGRADVGVDGGQVHFWRDAASCGCGNGLAVTAATVRHEIGHALGLWHTGDASDLMSGLPIGPVCDKAPSARELVHAAIVYARPVGNADPDNDPYEAVSLRPMVAR